MEGKDPGPIRSQSRNLRFLWLGYLWTQLLFAGMVFLIGRTLSPVEAKFDPTSFQDPLTLICVGLAAIILFGANGIPRLIQRSGFTKDISHPEDAAKSLRAAVVKAYYIRLAMVETCGLIGVFLAMVKHNPYLALPFLGIASAVLIANFPPAKLPGEEGKSFPPT